MSRGAVGGTLGKVGIVEVPAEIDSFVTAETTIGPVPGGGSTNWYDSVEFRDGVQFRTLAACQVVGVRLWRQPLSSWDDPGLDYGTWTVYAGLPDATASRSAPAATIQPWDEGDPSGNGGVHWDTIMFSEPWPLPAGVVAGVWFTVTDGLHGTNVSYQEAYFVGGPESTSRLGLFQVEPPSHIFDIHALTGAADFWPNGDVDVDRWIWIDPLVVAA